MHDVSGAARSAADPSKPEILSLDERAGPQGADDGVEGAPRRVHEEVQRARPANAEAGVAATFISVGEMPDGTLPDAEHVPKLRLAAPVDRRMRKVPRPPR